MKKNKDEIILIVILLIAAIMRINNYSELSLIADEISTLNRLKFESVGEVIEKGIRPDGHPAGVQLFLYYWIKVAGTSEAWLRLPFVICGILSVLFSYLIGKRWFGKQAGLFFASSLCFLEFPLTYSQIVRPYSPGLLFSLMSVFFWTKLLFDTWDTKKITTIIGYVMATALSAYMHYFSLMLVVIAGLCGLFFMKKNNYKTYLLSALAVFVLFIPHISITIGALKIGGLGGVQGWLAKPDKDWFWDYLSYCFNDSEIVYVLFSGIFFGSVIFNMRRIKLNKFHFLSLALFLLPFFISYVYSILVNPVLTQRNLLFSFPYLIIFCFSFVQYMQKKLMQYVGLGIFTFLGIYSTLIENKFYDTHHFGVIKELVLKTEEWSKKYGHRNITKTFNMISPKYMDYYFEKYKIPKDFIPYTNTGTNNIKAFIKIVTQSNSPYFLYGWTSVKYNPYEINSIIRSKYPYLIEKEYYFNSEIYLYAKEQPERQSDEIYVYESGYDFEEPNELWKGNEQTVVLDSSISLSRVSQLKEQWGYSHTFSQKALDILNSHDDIINITVNGYLSQATSDAKLVISFETPNREIYDYHDIHFSGFVEKPLTWTNIYLCSRIPKIRSKDDIIKIFVWNTGNGTVYIDDFRVAVNKGNPVIYGKRKIKVPLSQEERIKAYWKIF